jgi:pyruvate,water dikinase
MTTKRPQREGPERTDTRRAGPAYVLPFREITLDAIAEVGGKNASLGELLRSLTPRGVVVPDGFAVTAAAFHLHLAEAGLDSVIYAELDRLDLADLGALAATARSIRRRIADAPLPRAVREQLVEAYRALSREYGEEATDVAARSSATAEDLPSASFAGQQETYLNVSGLPALDAAVRACMASLVTDRAITYRAHHGFAHRGVGLSVGVQKMVRSDLGSAGVIFTLDTESGFRNVVLVTGAWGLGETVVQGRVRPDE